MISTRYFALFFLRPAGENFFIKILGFAQKSYPLSFSLVNHSNNTTKQQHYNRKSIVDQVLTYFFAIVNSKNLGAQNEKQYDT